MREERWRVAKRDDGDMGDKSGGVVSKEWGGSVEPD